jgi:hypothetical protein
MAVENCCDLGRALRRAQASTASLAREREKSLRWLDLFTAFAAGNKIEGGPT